MKVKLSLDSNERTLIVEKINAVLFHGPRKKLKEYTNIKQFIQMTNPMEFLGVL